jgi:hypothetical protein
MRFSIVRRGIVDSVDPPARGTFTAGFHSDWSSAVHRLRQLQRKEFLADAFLAAK